MKCLTPWDSIRGGGEGHLPGRATPVSVQEGRDLSGDSRALADRPQLHATVRPRPPRGRGRAGVWMLSLAAFLNHFQDPLVGREPAENRPLWPHKARDAGPIELQDEVFVQINRELHSQPHKV